VPDDDGRFQSFLAELSGRLSGLAADAVDDAVDRTLAEVVAFFDTDRASLLEIQAEDGAIAISHTWARPESVPIAVPVRVTGRFPWYHDRLRRGETVRLDRVAEELPSGAAPERSYAAEHAMFSHVAVPLLVGGRFVCALATATTHAHRHWTDGEVERIRIVGQLLAAAVHRKNIERELRESLAALHALQRRLEAENRYLREVSEAEAGFEEIAGRTRAIREVIASAAQVAPTGATVLLLGETGTGKGVLARAIHARSGRSERPLVKVNGAALPASLVESELFGHEKGAFTGAIAAKPGRFELADGGTLFLDEIGELSLEVQAKLLRVLQDGEFERVGSVRTRKVDVRIIAATNRDLDHAMASGRFREDLYYRISAFPIRVPPLRERREDIPLLVWEQIEARQVELGRRIERVPEDAMQALARYAWPGNIRELANVVERALILSAGPVLRIDAAFSGRAKQAEAAERLDEVERAHFVRVLERCRWRISGAGNAAELLGMNPSTLRSRLKKLQVERPTFS
jgi:transcriptional regulator with GAF, ATPase, and Fis domain